MTGVPRNGFRLGVTGHRDIDPHDPALTARVREQLTALDPEAVHPRWVLSSLAEGADRLVARVAMETLGARLIVPLPMPPTSYEEDFADAESVAEFRGLLEGAWDAFVVPGAGAGPGERSEGYARAGACVACRTDVLLALWDGRPARGEGGTGQIVQWVLAGEVPQRYRPATEGIQTCRPSGRVLHVHSETGEARWLRGLHD